MMLTSQCNLYRNHPVSEDPSGEDDCQDEGIRIKKDGEGEQTLD